MFNINYFVLGKYYLLPVIKVDKTKKSQTTSIKSQINHNVLKFNFPNSFGHLKIGFWKLFVISLLIFGAYIYQLSDIMDKLYLAVTPACFIIYPMASNISWSEQAVHVPFSGITPYSPWKPVIECW